MAKMTFSDAEVAEILEAHCIEKLNIKKERIEQIYIHVRKEPFTEIKAEFIVQVTV